MSAKKIDVKDSLSAKLAEWKSFSPAGKATVVAAVVAELAAKAGVWADLAKRPADKVRGPKWLWAVLSLVNGFGPGAYFMLGRKK